MHGKAMKCRICGRLYEFYSMMVGDQSVCAGCRDAARKGIRRPDTDEQIQRRQQWYGAER